MIIMQLLEGYFMEDTLIYVYSLLMVHICMVKEYWIQLQAYQMYMLILVI